MVLVVVLHSGLALDHYSAFYPEPIRVFNDIFEPYRMPTLMFLSGMLLSKSLQRRATVYFDGKLRKIGWPYLVWTVIALTAEGSISLFALGRAFYNPLETHLWYLWFLCIFYAVAWITRGIPPTILATVAIVLSVFAPSDYRLDKMTFLFAFFMLGHIFTVHAEKIAPRLRTPMALLLAGGLAVAASTMNVVGFKVLYEPAFAVCVLGAIAIAMRFVPLITGRVQAVFAYLGQRSIVLYIVHLLAIKVAGTLLARFGLSNPWVMFLLLVLVGFGSSLLLMWLRDRYAFARVLFEFPHIRRSTYSNVSA